MRLLHIVFLLFYIHVTMPFMYENNNENRTLVLKKIKAFYVGLTKPPVGFLQDRRRLPISEAIETKGKASAPFKNPYEKEWEQLSKLKRRNPGNGYRSPLHKFYKRNRRKYSEETARESSTSLEMLAWKKNFDEDWLRLKKEAIAIKMNSSNLGDKVNMMAARPWTLPCGDPEQHDLVWGSCTLASQCDGEYRIYRGDGYCGRTALVCCSVLYNTHDLYQGFDISFVDTDTDSSGEKRKIELGSTRVKRDKKHRARVARYRKRKRSKRVIKKKIRRIVHRLRKVLNRAFRNSTSGRKRKVEELTRLIKKMKSKYRHERVEAKHKYAGIIDNFNTDLYEKLIKLDSVNQHFLVNETFREFLQRYNITGRELRSLDLLNPYLMQYLAARTKFPEGILRLLAAARISLGFNSENKPKPLQSSLKVLRSLNLNEENKIKDVSEHLSDDDSYLLPQVSLKFDIYPTARTAVTESLPTIRSSTTLGKMYVEMQSYIEMNPKKSEVVNKDTRRSGRSFTFDRRKQKKKKDYIEYDVEYGALYL